MLNPFDQTQYSQSIAAGSTYDPNPLYSGGIPSLVASLRDAARLRQEAVRLGYIDGKGSGPLLVDITPTALDTEGAVAASTVAVGAAIGQFFSGSPFYDWWARGRCASPGPEDYFGFFRSVDAGSPSDSFVRTVSDLGLSDSDLAICVAGVTFDGDLPAFRNGVVAWAAATTRILNGLVYAHTGLETPLPNITCGSVTGDCGGPFVFALAAGETGPVDFLIDASAAVVCDNAGQPYGNICIQWYAGRRPGRLVIARTAGNTAEDSAIVRRPLWGLSGIGTSASNRASCDTPSGIGFCNPIQYETFVTGDNLPPLTWIPEQGPGSAQPIPPYMILVDSGCIATAFETPEPPWRDGQGEADYVCLEIRPEYLGISQFVGGGVDNPVWFRGLGGGDPGCFGFDCAALASNPSLCSSSCAANCCDYEEVCGVPPCF